MPRHFMPSITQVFEMGSVLVEESVGTSALHGDTGVKTHEPRRVNVGKVVEGRHDRWRRRSHFVGVRSIYPVHVIHIEGHGDHAGVPHPAKSG